MQKVSRPVKEREKAPLSERPALQLQSTDVLNSANLFVFIKNSLPISLCMCRCATVTRMDLLSFMHCSNPLGESNVEMKVHM